MRCPRNTLYIRLKGRGVQPVISLSVEDGVLDLGDALVGDTISSSFKVNKESFKSVCCQGNRRLLLATCVATCDVALWLLVTFRTEVIQNKNNKIWRVLPSLSTLYSTKIF